MVCLLRNFSKVKQPGTGYDKLPPPADKSEGADLARIKHYRNKMAHIDQNRISNADFVNQWTEISEVNRSIISETHLPSAKKGMLQSQCPPKQTHTFLNRGQLKPAFGCGIFSLC